MQRGGAQLFSEITQIKANPLTQTHCSHIIYALNAHFLYFSSFAGEFPAIEQRSDHHEPKGNHRYLQILPQHCASGWNPLLRTGFWRVQ